MCEHASNPWHPTTVPDASHGRPGDGHGRAGVHLVTGTPKGKVIMRQTYTSLDHMGQTYTSLDHMGQTHLTGPHGTDIHLTGPHGADIHLTGPHGVDTPHWTTWDRHTSLEHMG